MKPENKVLFTLFDIILLTIMVPITLDYYDLLRFNSTYVVSRNFPVVGNYLPEYLFWGSLVIVILLLIGLVIILCYPKSYAELNLASGNDTLRVKKSAIEGFINEKLNELEYLKDYKIKVLFYRNRIDIDIIGSIKPRIDIDQKIIHLEQEIDNGLHEFFGLNQPIKFNVEIKSLSLNKDSQSHMRVV